MNNKRGHNSKIDACEFYMLCSTGHIGESHAYKSYMHDFIRTSFTHISYCAYFYCIKIIFHFGNGNVRNCKKLLVASV
jgi:hypothetical protein